MLRLLRHTGIVFIAVALVYAAITTAGERPSEYQVKAAYIYNFAKFVEWPDTGAYADRPEIVIGILEPDPFGSLMDGIVVNKTVNDKPLRVVRSTRIAELSNCHIVFIGANSHHRDSELLSALNGKPILTVGEGAGFLSAGGMISFLLIDETVQFLINPGTARDAGLSISSKLLKVAAEVIKE